MKQPEFRIIKVSGRVRDHFYLEQRGLLWGWNRVPRYSYYDHSDYDFESVSECEKEVAKQLRERKLDVIVKEINTDLPFTLTNQETAV